MVGDPWTDIENDLIVADYFTMLKDDLAGCPYNKARHNRELQDRTGRSKGAIEFKHQNISAVLVGLAQPWIPGYRPALNFQSSLVGAVWRWLERNRGFPAPTKVGRRMHNADPQEELIVRAPPTNSNQPPPDGLEQFMTIAETFNVAGRDERNRALGCAGEECVLAHERRSLDHAGRGDLAKRVQWVSRDVGDGAGYDIASYSPDGQSRLIEVKTTNGWERTPFWISRNELRVSKERPDVWRLFRLWNFARVPCAFELTPPLERHVTLIASSFEARFS